VRDSDIERVVLKPRVLIPFAVWQKIMAYILNCPVEINGFGVIEVGPFGVVVQDVFILQQFATPTGVETDQGTLDRFVAEMARTGGNPGLIKFQWHSHVSMPAYFSGVDTANIERWPGDWLISLVANKRGEFSCRLDVLRPIRVGIDIHPEIVSTIPMVTMEIAAHEVATKVRQAGFLRRSVPVTDGRPVVPSTHGLDLEEIEFVEQEPRSER